MSKTEMMNSCLWLQTFDDEYFAFYIQELILISKTSPTCLSQQVTPVMLTLILDYCRFHHEKAAQTKNQSRMMRNSLG